MSEYFGVRHTLGYDRFPATGGWGTIPAADARYDDVNDLIGAKLRLLWYARQSAYGWSGECERHRRDVERIGLAAARRRRMKLRSCITVLRPARPPHIAGWIDQGRDHDGCRPAEPTYTTAPADWACVLLQSGDWQDDEHTCRWFCNAMCAADPDAVIPEDPFWDDVPMHPHGRPIHLPPTEYRDE